MERNSPRSSPHFHLALTLLLALHLFSLAASSSLDSDLGALLAFKEASDPTNKLASWNRSDPAPCTTWYGVWCAQGRVTRLVLERLSLSGAGGLAVLTQLGQLRVLSLKYNALSGPIPDLSSLPNLKLLFLAHNFLSGPLPTSLSSLSRLYRLDLSIIISRALYRPLSLLCRICLPSAWTPTSSLDPFPWSSPFLTYKT